MDRNHGCIERHEFIDISLIFLATNLDEKVKNIDYLKIKNFNLVSHVPFIRFLEAINWIWAILLNQTILNMMHGSMKTSIQ
ncbi:hypothetical protein [Prochlorococcus sp. MIT 0604]|uniref:hypothetical protein n=1 Tax=Prochlorococcus sp. MIT 0604 TaxID=1501268 RepID=UPI0004F8096A|nr:hypothetical protein [Prochlorococcus sp. MIT 0604]AIQ94441.1 hypothetical protein EW14_0418 [Prochlorococcus sp. MIT 0604]